MTVFEKMPNPQGLVKLSGQIAGYKVTRGEASFVFTESDQARFGVIAIAASLAGMGAQAVSVASNATAMEEEADHVEFTLNGHQVSGWLWRSPFREGDVVDVAAEWRTDHYEVLGVARPADRTIALYPHCTRSRVKHIRNAFKWWVYTSMLFELGMVAISSTFETITVKDFWSRLVREGDALWYLAGIHVFIGIAIYSMARKWLPFTRIAEAVFRTLELPNPGNIDLVKSSKGRHKPEDAFEYGAMFFRY